MKILVDNISEEVNSAPNGVRLVIRPRIDIDFIR
jgi:hypothetical protein